jgi:hypothetical protein
VWRASDGIGSVLGQGQSSGFYHRLDSEAGSLVTSPLASRFVPLLFLSRKEDVVTRWCATLCLALASASALAAETEAKRPVASYTNDDLDRVRRYRDQTGVDSVTDDSVPAVAQDGRASGGRRLAAIHDEAWWRKEAARVRDRLRVLDERIAELRRRIAERRTEPWTSRPRRTTDPNGSAWEARLAALEHRRRALESDFEERARREGALPGWTR